MTAIMIVLAEIPDLESLADKHRHDLRWMKDHLPACNDNPDLETGLLHSAAKALSPGHPFNSLRCRLSDYYLDAAQGRSVRRSSTALERAVCRDPARRAKRSAIGSRSWLDDLAARFEIGVRAGSAFGGADRHGHYVVYPDSGLIERRLIEIDQLTATSTRHPVLRAIVAAALLLNLHPMRDGNGRISRLAFNDLIGQATDTAFYLPIFELAEASAGGWMYATRMAWQRGDWEPLIHFHLNATRLFCRDESHGAMHPSDRPAVASDAARQ